MELDSSIKRAITVFDKAAQAWAWHGSEPPDTWHAIEQNYADTRAQLERLIVRKIVEAKA